MLRSLSAWWVRRCTVLAVAVAVAVATVGVAPAAARSGGAVAAQAGGAAPPADDGTGRPDASLAPAAVALPYKRVSIPDRQTADVAVDSTGLILVAGQQALYVYHPSGLYQGRLDLGEPLVDVATVGDAVFATGSSTTWRLQAGTLATVAQYARPYRFSSAPGNGDLVHARDGSLGNGFATLRLSTGALTPWTAPGSAVHAIPNGTRVLVSGGGDVREYDTASTPPTLVAAVAVGVPSTVAGVAADGSHAVVLLDGQPRRVPLPLSSIAGTDLQFSAHGPMLATAGSGGWEAFVGSDSSPGEPLRFVRPNATGDAGVAQAGVAYPAAAWNPEGTMLAAVSVQAVGTAVLQLYAPPGAARPATGFSGAAGEYRGITPTRILDTRDGTGAPLGALGPGGRVDVQVLGVGDIPAAGVQAVAVNITVVDPTEATYVSAFPTLGSAPFVSNVNVLPGDVRPNLAIVRVGDGGRVSVLNAQGLANVVVDVQGYFSTRNGPAGGRYHTLVPTRLLDSRNDGPIGPRSLRALAVRNTGGVPASATAVALNVTAVGPSTATFLTVHPSDVGRPLASNLNARAAETVANLVFARIGADGNVALYNEAGATHVVVDVVGYWDDDRSTEAGRFIPFGTPFRWVDSRDGPGPIRPGGTVWVQMAGFPTEDPQIPLPLDGASAVVYNLTATNTTAGGFLTAFPDTQPTPPLASNLNFAAGQTVAALAVTGYGDGGRINMFNPAGSTDVIVDLTGYFTSAWF